MLPTKGIFRSLLSTRPPTLTCGRLTDASSSHSAASRRWPQADRRQYSSSLRRPLRCVVIPKVPPRISARAWQPLARAAAVPIRAFSVWGWIPGTKKPPTEDGVAAQSRPLVVSEVPQSPEPPQAASMPPPAEPVASPAPEVSTPSDVDFDSISDSIHGKDILDMPEQLGYLHAIGLDYGYGPTSMMQWTLEHVHIWAGLGWGASIIVTALALRALMFYPQVRGLRFSGTLQTMHKDPRFKEAVHLKAEAIRERDNAKHQRGQFLDKLVKQQYDVNYAGFLWSFLQIPFTFGLFRIVNGMVHIPVPALETAGFLWFRDLAATDPFFLLPTISTAFMIGAMLIGSKYSSAYQRKNIKSLAYIFGVVGVIGTSFLSAAINLMAVAVGGATLLITLVLDNPIVRRKLQLPAASVSSPLEATYEAPRASSGLRERLKDNLDGMSKGISERMASYTGQYNGDEMEKAKHKRQEMLTKLENMRKQQDRADFMKKYKQQS